MALPVSEVKEAEASGVTEVEATGVIEAEVTGVTEVEATGVIEAEVTGVTEVDATGVTEAEASGVVVFEVEVTGGLLANALSVEVTAISADAVTIVVGVVLVEAVP